MKKILAIVLALVLVFAVAGCGAAAPASSSSAAESSASESASTSVENNAPAGAVKIGLGSTASIGGSKAATADDGAKAQADVTMCTVAVDNAGKITAVSFDVVQAKVAFDTKGQLKSDVAEAIKTKKQLGADYGMKKASSIGKEWDEQIAALEQYITGKTLDEVKAMKVATKEDKTVADVAELTSSCTMDIAGYLAVLEIAVNNAK